MIEITMYHYLFIGLVKVLISIEMMLLGVNINFVTFASYCDNIEFNGYIMALFYIGLGAVELAVALFIFYLMYQKKESDNIEKYTDL